MTDIRIVLVGAKGSGKTSTFNTILGRADALSFSRTSRCRVGEGVVFGRHVTVVDTPGWWRNYFCNETPMFDRRELVLGLSLCPPGPHVFLLVVRVDRSFTETNRRAVQEHVELMGEGIWARALVVFSFGDWLGATTAERYLETEGTPLRWLVDRCNNRYHLINNKTRGDGFQVRELIGKIEETVAAGNRKWHYEVERRLTETLERRKRGEKERAEQRMKKREEQRMKEGVEQTQMETFRPPSELRLVLVGGSRSGKSSCGNTVLGRQSFDTGVQTTSCVQKQGSVHGRTLTLTDTPGGFSVTSDLLRPPSAVLLVVNVSAAFRDVHREAVERQLEVGGVQVWRRALVLFSFGDWLGDTSVEERIESEGKALQRLVEKCGNRYHVLDNKHRDGGAQVGELMELIENMMEDDRMDVLHRGEHVTRGVSSRPEQLMENVTLDQKGSDGPGPGVSEQATPPPIRSKDPDAAGPMVAFPPGPTGAWTGFLDRRVLVSRLASMVCSTDRPWWTEVDQMGFRGNLPVWFVSDDAEGQRSPLRHPTAVWFLAPAQTRTPTEDNINNGQLICRDWTVCRSGALRGVPGSGALRGVPGSGALRGVPGPGGLREVPGSGGLREVPGFGALRGVPGSGGLREVPGSGDLQDHQGGTSLEELEAFIDSYVQIWEQTMESCYGDEPELDQVSDRGDEVLETIIKKLSKLDVLEEIRVDLAELKKSLEISLKSIEEFREKSLKDPQSPGGSI